jgi:hypothetical protein
MIVLSTRFGPKHPEYCKQLKRGRNPARIASAISFSDGPVTLASRHLGPKQEYTNIVGRQHMHFGVSCSISAVYRFGTTTEGLLCCVRPFQAPLLLQRARKWDNFRSTS